MRNGAHRLVRFAGRKRKLTMFALRKFESKDVPSCAVCFYESFFDCPLSENDVRFLRDYAQVLIEKCSFTFVAEQDGQAVGFITGNFNRQFDKTPAKRRDVKPHYGRWLKCFLKFAFGGYKTGAPFKEQFDRFFTQAKERTKDTPLACDCELTALCSRRDFRKGLDTALIGTFLKRCRESGVKTVAFSPIRMRRTLFTKNAVLHPSGKNRTPSAAANRGVRI